MIAASIFFTVVLLLSLAAAAALVFFSQMATRLRQWVAPGLIFAAVIAGLLSSLFSSRVLTLGDDLVDGAGAGDASGTLFAKVVLAGVLGLSCAALLGWLTWWARRTAVQKASDSLAIAERPDWALIGAFAFFFFCYGLVPLAFAPEFHFRVALVYPLFFFVAVLLYLPYSRISPIRIITNALLLICLTSLVAAVLRPDVAVLSGYRGLLPGFSYRLYGLTAHPNSLGYAASCLLVLALADTNRATMTRLATLVVAAGTLLFTQSKTSIVACMAGVAVVVVWRAWSGRFGSAGFQRSPGSVLIGRALLAFTAATIVALVWFVVIEPSLRSSVLGSLDQREVGRLGTFTGRTAIWQFAMESAEKQPWFGYGLGLWTDETRLRIGLLGASSAHNVFLEVLVRSGILGLVALFILLAVMLNGLFRSVAATSAASLALLVIFFVRGFFEVPIQVHGVIGSGVFAFLALLVCSDRSVRTWQRLTVNPGQASAKAVGSRALFQPVHSSTPQGACRVL